MCRSLNHAICSHVGALYRTVLFEMLSKAQDRSAFNSTINRPERSLTCDLSHLLLFFHFRRELSRYEGASAGPTLQLRTLASRLDPLESTLILHTRSSIALRVAPSDKLYDALPSLCRTRRKRALVSSMTQRVTSRSRARSSDSKTTAPRNHTKPIQNTRRAWLRRAGRTRSLPNFLLCHSLVAGTETSTNNAPLAQAYPPDCVHSGVSNLGSKHEEIRRLKVQSCSSRPRPSNRTQALQHKPNVTYQVCA